MNIGKTIRILAAVGLTMSFVVVARAQEVRQPMPAPPPGQISPTPPPCIESRFSKIILNHITDANGVLGNSYYLFVVYWYIDGQHYYVLSPSWKSAVGKTFTKDPVTGLWKLTWKEGDYTLCVTAPFYEELVTPYDYWVQQQPFTKWFQNTYPTYAVPGVATSPTPTPPVGV